MNQVEVKIKNKPNELKAVDHLGKYSQHKGLLNEVIKTLDWLDDINKKINNEVKS
jgi:hypothetical protein